MDTSDNGMGKMFDIIQRELSGYYGLYERYRYGVKLNAIRLNALRLLYISALECHESHPGHLPSMDAIEKLGREVFFEPTPDLENARVKGYFPSEEDAEIPSFLTTALWVCNQMMPGECSEVYLTGIIDVSVSKLFTEFNENTLRRYQEALESYERFEWQQENPDAEEQEFNSIFAGRKFGELDKKEVKEVHRLAKKCMKECQNNVRDITFFCADQGRLIYDVRMDERRAEYTRNALDVILTEGAHNELE